MKSSVRTEVISESAKNTDLSKLYQCGACICYVLLALPFVSMPIIPLLRGAPWAMQLLPLLGLTACTALGYGIQTLNGRFWNIQRSPVELSYEDIRRRYRPMQAIPCHIISLMIGLFSIRFGLHLLDLYAASYDAYSLYPLQLAMSAVFMTEFGGYLWFFPYQSLISMRRVGGMLLCLLINFVLTNLYNRGYQQMYGIYHGLNLLAEIAVIALVLILLNQTFLSRIYKGNVARGINDAAKKYSLRVVMIALSCIVLLPWIVYYVLFGIGKLIMYLLESAVVQSTTAEADRPAVQEELRGELVDFLKMRDGESGQGSLLFLLLGVLSLALLLVLIVPDLREKVRNLWRCIKAFLVDLLHTPMSVRRKRRQQVVEQQMLLSFTDTVESTRRRKKDTFSSIDHTETYRDFERRLKALTDPNEKIQYAYAVVAGQMQHQACHVVKSDTPREISEKVRKYDLIEDIAALTTIFEQLRYADSPALPQTEQDQTLERLCLLVKTYLY